MAVSFESIEELYFIWNADWSIGGAIQAAKDFVLGIESCALCQIAYDGISEKQAWKECKQALPVPVTILYRNQMSDDLKDLVGARLPVVVVRKEGNVQIVLEKQEIETCEGNVEAFKQLLLNALQALAA